MSKLIIERTGGLAGFGGVQSHLRSKGEMNEHELSDTDRKTVDDLFKHKGHASSGTATDTFRYKITRTTAGGTETIETVEHLLPEALIKCVKDEIV